MRRLRAADLASDRGHVQDAAALALAHVTTGLLRGHEGALEVHVDRQGEVFVRDLEVRLHIRQPVSVGGSVRSEINDYPEEAMRQLVRNAVLHRSYEGTNAPVRVTWFDDRVEIQSPGGPFGQVTKSSFGTPGVTDYRNPTLAEALKRLGFVERFGVGIPIARERLAANGNPPLESIVEDAHVLAVVRRRP